MPRRSGRRAHSRGSADRNEYSALSVSFMLIVVFSSCHPTAGNYPGGMFSLRFFFAFGHKRRLQWATGREWAQRHVREVMGELDPMLAARAMGELDKLLAIPAPCSRRQLREFHWQLADYTRRMHLLVWANRRLWTFPNSLGRMRERLAQMAAAPLSKQPKTRLKRW